MLELTEEDLDGPAVFVPQRADLGGNIQQVGRDSQEPVAIDTRRSSLVLALGNVRLDLPDHQPDRMIGKVSFGLRTAQSHHLIGEYSDGAIGLGQRSFFPDFIDAVVANSTDVAGLAGHAGVEEAELRVSPVHHVAAIRVDRPLEDGAFIVVSSTVSSHVDPRRLVAIDLEMRVQPPFDHPLARLPLQDGRGHDPGHRGEDRRIDQRQRVSDVLQSRVIGQRLKRTSEFPNDLNQPLGIEHGGRFRERSQ